MALDVNDLGDLWLCLSIHQDEILCLHSFLTVDVAGVADCNVQLSIIQRVQEKMCFYFENQRFRIRILACHFHDSISIEVGTFMICSFVLYYR